MSAFGTYTVTYDGTLMSTTELIGSGTWYASGGKPSTPAQTREPWTHTTANEIIYDWQAGEHTIERLRELIIHALEEAE